MTKYFLAAILMLSLIACSEDEDFRFNEDMKLIGQYIAANDLQDVQMDENGLHYIIKNPGNPSGLVPADNSKVAVRYKGQLMNGLVFDQRDSIEFELNTLVQGFRLATRKLREDGSIFVIIPSHLGYGSTGRQGIPANSILVFDIDLLKVLEE